MEGIARAMMRLLESLDRNVPARRVYGRVPGPIGQPKSFTRYVDPDSRFEFGYPSEWGLKCDDGVHAASRKRGTFARVDVVPSGVDFWRNLQKALLQEGGCLRLGKRRPGSPGGRTGEIEVGHVRFLWEAVVYEVRGEQIILSTGNVLEPRRAPEIELYEDKILAGIRRSFKLGRGLLPSPR